MKRRAPRSLVGAFHFLQIQLLHNVYHKPGQVHFRQPVVDRRWEKVIRVADNGLEVTHGILCNRMNNKCIIPYYCMLCRYF